MSNRSGSDEWKAAISAGKRASPLTRTPKSQQHKDAIRAGALKRYESADERARAADRTREVMAKRRETHPPKYLSPSEKARKSRYGVSPEQVKKLFDAQDGLCWICCRPINLGLRGCHVDHDHDSGRVRGLLCQRCNPQLGWFERHHELIVAYLSGVRGVTALRSVTYARSHSQLIESWVRSHRLRDLGEQIVIVLVLSSACSVVHAQERPYLQDSDSESWLNAAGVRYPPGGVKLSESLVTRVGAQQPFNPAVVVPIKYGGLTNVKLYLQFPDTVQVHPSRAWISQGRRTYTAALGTINPGEAINASDALLFTPLVAGTLRIAYLMSAFEMIPLSGVIQVEVR